MNPRRRQYPLIRRGADAASRLPTWGILGGLVLLSSLLRFWAAVLVPVPWIAPDEFVYGELGRSLYRSGALELLGSPIRFYTLVVPALVGGPLSLADRAAGYDLLKGVQATTMSLTAVPVYLWARSLASRRAALVAAALTLAVPGLAYSGLIMTEVEFYPLGLLALLAIARTLELPSLRRQGLVLAAILLAAATRLQALVLLPVYVTALCVKSLLDRDLKTARRLGPSLAGLAALAGGWSVYQLRKGGPATDVLGAYRAAGEAHYSVRDAFRFVLYHLGDLVLMTGLFPVCAVGVLLAGAVVRRHPSPALRAYLAVAAAAVLWFTAEVGVFASKHVGRLAERDLLVLVPLLFVGFVAWLDESAPRPRRAAALSALAGFLLLLELPIGKLVSLAAIPDAFTLIPLYRLQVRAPGLSLELVLDVVGAAAALAFVLVPRRRVWLLPAAILVVFAGVSLSASRVVTAQATLVRRSTLAPSRAWIDDRADGPVAYLYTGEIFWNAVWESTFWNGRVDALYDLLTYQVPGPLPQPSVGPLGDGRLVLADGQPIEARYAVAASHVSFRGVRVAEAPGADLFLWRLDPPFRLDTWIQTEPTKGEVLPGTRVHVYACRRGRLLLRLRASRDGVVTLLRNGHVFRVRQLREGEIWSVSVPALPAPLGRRKCTFDIADGGSTYKPELRFLR